MLRRICQWKVLIKGFDKIKDLLSVRMEAGVGEAFALVLAKKSAVPKHYVVNLISRAFSVKSVPL